MTARSGAAVLTALSALDVAAGMMIVLETSEVGNQPNVELAATAMMRFCWYLLFRVSLGGGLQDIGRGMECL